MITGDNPLTAVHVARDVEIVDRDVLILDLKEGATRDDGSFSHVCYRSRPDLVFRTPDESIVIDVDPSTPFDKKLFADYDICITGAALKQYEDRKSWLDLVQHTWVYARVSPAQKEFILVTLKDLGYVTLMAGDGTNDVGALKQAHIGVALLDGTPEDLKAIAQHQQQERLKKVYEQQVKISARFNQPPPPVPKGLHDLYPELVATQQAAASSLTTARKKNPMEKVCCPTLTPR
jgi:cation-transporting ATPase 13A1